MDPNPAPDEELVRLVARRDEAAFEELVRRHQHRVLGTIHRHVGEREAAEDISQEVFVILWRKAGTFKGRARFSTWLYRVVVNQCLQFRRSPAVPGAFPIIVGNVLNLASQLDVLPSDFVLLDSSGRAVLSLEPGANDIRHIAPGVDFVHSGRRAPSVRRHA